MSLKTSLVTWFRSYLQAEVWITSDMCCYRLRSLDNVKHSWAAFHWIDCKSLYVMVPLMPHYHEKCGFCSPKTTAIEKSLFFQVCGSSKAFFLLKLGPICCPSSSPSIAGSPKPPSLFLKELERKPLVWRKRNGFHVTSITLTLFWEIYLIGTVES